MSASTPADPAVALIHEVLGQRVISEGSVAAALERLRLRAHARQAGFWIVDAARATCVLDTGLVSEIVPGQVVDDGIFFEDLRRLGALRCRAGEISAGEKFLSRGVRSCVIAAGPISDGRSGVLVIGWSEPDPPCGDETLVHLRTAAAILQCLLRGASGSGAAVSAADVLNAMADRIVVVDRNGTIAPADMQSPRAVPPVRRVTTVRADASIDELWRSDQAPPEAAAIRAGVQSVVEGGARFFQSAYSTLVDDDEQWCVVTATPLYDKESTAVVTQTVIRAPVLVQLEKALAFRGFQRLADTFPVPVWMLASNGRVVYTNLRSIEIAGGRIRSAQRANWTDTFHVSDRRRARAALAEAAANQSTFELEVRIESADGTYRWVACVGAPLLSNEGAPDAYVVFCSDISAKRRAEWAAADLASKLLAAAEAERSRIGRELHDDLGQQAAVLAAKLNLLARMPRLPMRRVRAGLADAEQSLQDLAVDIHNLSHQLHPAKLRLLGLVPTLEALCREVSASSGVRVHFMTEHVPADVPELIALSAYRVAQEALQNALKHSGADDIHVNLVADSDELILRVTDRGRGFDPVGSDVSGIGLLTMRERVELSGGRLRIDASAADGTTVEARLPLGHEGNRG